jgi:hypothetical protein
MYGNKIKEKYLIINSSDKGLIPKMYKELKNLTLKESTSQ